MAKAKKPPKPKPLPKWSIKKIWQWLEEIGGPYQSKFLKQVSQIRAMARVEDEPLRKAIVKYDKVRQPTKKQLAEEAKKVAAGKSTNFSTGSVVASAPRVLSAPTSQPNVSMQSKDYSAPIPAVITGISPVTNQRANSPGGLLFTSGAYGK